MTDHINLQITKNSTSDKGSCQNSNQQHPQKFNQSNFPLQQSSNEPNYNIQIQFLVQMLIQRQIQQQILTQMQHFPQQQQQQHQGSAFLSIQNQQHNQHQNDIINENDSLFYCNSESYQQESVLPSTEHSLMISSDSHSSLKSQNFAIISYSPQMQDQVQQQRTQQIDLGQRCRPRNYYDTVPQTQYKNYPKLLIKSALKHFITFNNDDRRNFYHEVYIVIQPLLNVELGFNWTSLQSYEQFIKELVWTIFNISPQDLRVPLQYNFNYKDIKGDLESKRFLQNKVFYEDENSSDEKLQAATIRLTLKFVVGLMMEGKMKAKWKTSLLKDFAMHLCETFEFNDFGYFYDNWISIYSTLYEITSHIHKKNISVTMNHDDA